MDRKIAFIFPGQGSQYVGMGKEIYENYDIAKKVYEKANKILNIDIAKLCFESDEEMLKQTKNTQIAIFVTEMAITEVLKENGIKAEHTSGLSLGEYSSLCYSNVLNLEQAIPLVRKRGEYMQEYIEPGNYSMAAVIGLEDEIVEKVCKEQEGFIVPVNYNCPGQIVVAGDEELIDGVVEKFNEVGAKRVIKLNLKSPFHTDKLNQAKEKLYEELKKVSLNKLNCKVFKNIDGKEYTNEDDIKTILANHIVSPVYFSKCLENMIKTGVTTFIEIGPGKTLSGFVKKINKEIEVFNIENKETLENVLSIIKN